MSGRQAGFFRLRLSSAFHCGLCCTFCDGSRGFRRNRAFERCGRILKIAQFKRGFFAFLRKHATILHAAGAGEVGDAAGAELKPGDAVVVDKFGEFGTAEVTRASGG